MNLALRQGRLSLGHRVMKKSRGTRLCTSQGQIPWIQPGVSPDFFAASSRVSFQDPQPGPRGLQATSRTMMVTFQTTRAAYQ